MADGDRQGITPRQQPSPDILIIGAGIMGLWSARYAALQGLRVHLVEESRAGAGASGGLLGALMPHMPNRWNEKKQFQFDALVSLEHAISDVEEKTGLSAGYRRAGRLIPLTKPHLVRLAEGHAQDALSRWRSGSRQFYWHVHATDRAFGLLRDGAAPHGLVEDTLAARVNPRGLIAVLKAALLAEPRVTVVEGTAVRFIDPTAGNARLSDGTTLFFGHAIIANGYRAGDLIEPIAGPLKKPVVVPVKGQAALLSADLGQETPVIYLDGLYIVTHKGGYVAVGSTSEDRFDDAFSTDHRLDTLIGQAQSLVPALEGAPVVERWAGSRPKAIGRDPMVGSLPGHARISVLTGGFKVSFGIAHSLAAALVEAIAAERPVCALPDGFSPRSHLEEAGLER